MAIATALVPPLCSAGLGLAYSSFSLAKGAALLFSTNFVAIVIAAALTFRAMGVTAAKAQSGQRLWVFRVAAILGITIIMFLIPLQRALNRSLVEAKPQPSTYPLARSVIEALEEHIEQTDDVELIAAGRPSSPKDPTDVQVFVGAPGELDREFGRKIIEIVHTTMQDTELVVEVHCLRELWRESTGTNATELTDPMPPPEPDSEPEPESDSEPNTDPTF